LNFKFRIVYRKNIYDRYYLQLIQKKLSRASNNVGIGLFLEELLVIDVSVFKFLSIHSIEFNSCKQRRNWIISRGVIGD
jgi:hypothetical protein